MVGDGAFSPKIYYITIFLKIINLEGHQNCYTGSRPAAIGGFCLLVELRRWRVCYQRGLPRLVYIKEGSKTGLRLKKLSQLGPLPRVS